MSLSSSVLVRTLLLLALVAMCISAASYGRPMKRAFDTFGSSGFHGLDKRFDYAPYGFEKRAFDSFGSSFGGFDRRK